MPVRVSVVVPVYNPGEPLDELIASLAAQTMPASDFEVLLCDDGSDDATRQQLTRIAAEHPNVRVANLPHSGWPGTPRNHGIDTADGTYLHFVDQDDRLFPKALQSLCDYADRHGSDVIVGREVGIGRDLPKAIFARNVPRAKLGKHPLLEMLTPHKMFRTAFLRENGIRFPAGRVRLEDHLFVMEAYFAADTISILASVPCYGWVKREGSASSARIDPESYYPHLEAVLDLVEAHTEPGKLRDRLLRHWLRGKILKRLSARQMARYPDEYRQRLLDVVTPLVERRFGPGVDAGLAFPNRVRVALLRAGRRDDLLTLARHEVETTCRAELTRATWTRGGGLQLTIRTLLTRDGEDALVFEPSPGDRSRRVWRAPEAFADLGPAVLDATRDLDADRVVLSAQDDGGPARRRLAEQPARDLAPVPVAIDPLRVFEAESTATAVRLTVQVRRAGWTFDAPLTADAAVLEAAGRSPLLAGRRCRLVLDDAGAVVLQREYPGGGLRDAAGRAVRRLRKRLASRGK